jgi:hypothetical protein
VAGQVGDENTVALGQRRREGAPVLDRPAETVHEHERRAVAGDGVAKPGSAPVELVDLESLQTGFAVRHH